jgi:hypothetical protein
LKYVKERDHLEYRRRWRDGIEMDVRETVSEKWSVSTSSHMGFSDEVSLGTGIP